MAIGLADQLVLGKPMVMWGGLTTLTLLLITATVGFLNNKGIRVIPFKWHPVLAGATILMAIMHGLLGLSRYW